MKPNLRLTLWPHVVWLTGATSLFHARKLLLRRAVKIVTANQVCQQLWLLRRRSGQAWKAAAGAQWRVADDRAWRHKRGFSCINVVTMGRRCESKSRTKLWNKDPHILQRECRRCQQLVVCLKLLQADFRCPRCCSCVRCRWRQDISGVSITPVVGLSSGCRRCSYLPVIALNARRGSRLRRRSSRKDTIPGR